MNISDVKTKFPDLYQWLMNSFRDLQLNKENINGVYVRSVKEEGNNIDKARISYVVEIESEFYYDFLIDVMRITGDIIETLLILSGK